MNANKTVKAESVAEIKNHFEHMSAMVVVNYSGMTVKEFQALRKELKKAHVSLQVYKNRLVKVALEGSKYEALGKMLQGQNAFAFGSKDDIAPAKILANFAKTLESKALKLVGGVYDHKVINASEVAGVAALPSYDEALGILARQMIGALRYITVGLNEYANKHAKH